MGGDDAIELAFAEACAAMATAAMTAKIEAMVMMAEATAATMEAAAAMMEALTATESTLAAREAKRVEAKLTTAAGGVMPLGKEGGVGREAGGAGDPPMGPGLMRQRCLGGPPALD